MIFITIYRQSFVPGLRLNRAKFNLPSSTSRGQSGVLSPEDVAVNSNPQPPGSFPHATRAVIGKRLLPNGPFSAFFNDFEIFNGPFLIIVHRLLWAIFQVNGTMAHGPLPSQSLHGSQPTANRPPHLVASYDTQGGAEDVFYPDVPTGCSCVQTRAAPRLLCGGNTS